MREVAAAASVSVGTVSNVLNAPDKVAPATVARVQAAIDKLGFVRNDAARQLKAGRSRSVGLVVLDIGNPFFTDIARAAERRAGEHNLTVLLGTSDDDSARERAYVDAFDEQRVYGLLVSPVGEDLNRLVTLRERGTPVVLVDRDGAGTPFDSVAVDDVAGGCLAVEHLCATGRRKIAFVGGPGTLRQIRDRRRGAAGAVAKTLGATLEVIDTDAPSVLAGRAAGEELCRRARGDRPDAVFCANDLLAIGVLQALSFSGDVRVPEDMAVVGYDDIDFARSAVVPLTSVRQPTGAIGTTAVDLLISAAEDPGDRTPEHVVFQPELVVRDSTG
ncbi:LacI family DNA-binding transcriptional regulator [Mycolicibacterium goodii]|uniref:LacI family transcriptional regulator n=1 Tax=Mycolicibacterium goodii TaxID=134601 RepID=A0ABS6HVQ0_MYCGD|nr:LacI family DNA-binding transcriptional regulator [Mycolicibacterium goodii]MBU8808120.1 LacI family transcriptional regulator [Mycolicibacterium goodii]MBU8825744.1 LacI family transcriptional regulator [Mycolicibacterium goodii]MBU8829844.1 LacI family transcriptional regulator [Mycolicibacterium goodii]MBU8839975.1 LacI family transcriptional regulator [Mycolicibacterium goodii]ULN48355.1 LacI family transcriptional regulator [Mycolicibacterium goodii]